MSGTDYKHFVALYRIDPDGPERDNQHTAMILSQTANLNRRKDAPVIGINKFMLSQKTPVAPASDEQKIKAFQAQIERMIKTPGK